eukprot:10145.XXX_183501_183617_1 [CDS] Oithona nana genome sequencing.
MGISRVIHMQKAKTGWSCSSSRSLSSSSKSTQMSSPPP